MIFKHRRILDITKRMRNAERLEKTSIHELFDYLKLVSAIFSQIYFFHQMLALKKL